MTTVDTRAWELLVRFHRRTATAMDQSLREGTGHSLDDYDVLHQLAVAGEPLRMTDLATRLLVANSSCNRIVGRLADDGLLARRTGPVDRREVLVELTSLGRRLHRRMAVTHTRDIRTHVGDRLTEAEHRTLGDLLGRLLVPADPDR